MINLRLAPAMHYQLKAMLKAALWILGILALITVALNLLAGLHVEQITQYPYEPGVIVDIDEMGITVRSNLVFFSVGSILLITLFIIGICSIREDFKFFLQHGLGRRTTYLSTLFINLISGAVFGLLCTILNIIGNHFPSFPAYGISFPVDNFFFVWILHTLSFVAAWQLGAFFSLVYYRMNKMQQIVFTVIAIAIVIFAIPSFIEEIIFFFVPNVAIMGAALTSFFGNSFGLATSLFAFGLVTALMNFLLIRRVQVKN
ncbi:MAG: hypothetical protein FWC66_04045 [Oscillospiraceae bacterium]|nr:hypothetical protein [Oscillospiraceae bacterium]